jgi:putative nucleotidyltransferase with HDIG domain
MSNRLTSAWPARYRIVGEAWDKVRVASVKLVLMRFLGLQATLSDLSLPARVYLFFIWSASTILMLWGIHTFTWSLQTLAVVLVFAAVYCGVDLFPICLRPGEVEVTLAVSIGIAAVMLLPPSSVFLVVLVGTVLAEIRFTRPWYKKTFNVGQRVITFTTLAWIYQYIAGNSGHILDSIQGVAAVIVVWVGHYVLNVGLVTLVISLDLRIPVVSVWRANYRDVFYHQVFTAPLGTLLALLTKQQPLAVVLVVPPLVILYRAYELTAEIRRQTVNALLAFANSIDARDPSTFQHSRRVGELALAIAKQMGLPPAEAEVINLSARLHDLGKVSIPDAVLFKDGKLSGEEYQTIKEHPAKGAHIVESFPIFGVGHDIIKYHHERYDGKGYPEQLVGEHIPLGARIIAVADAYDAMTSDRPYRAALSREVALQQIIEGRGNQFDPAVVDAFLTVMGAAPQILALEAQTQISPPVYTSPREELAATTCSS